MPREVQFSSLINEPSRVGEVRRAARELGIDLEFDEEQLGKLAVVSTEVANNLVKHAKEGEVLLRAIPREGGGDVEVLAIDRGPGIKNVAQCLRDGYSTAGTPGTGLGAISRMSSEFDMHSVPGVGTALVARVGTSNSGRSPRFEIGAVCRPIAGERACGDAWSGVEREGGLWIGVADGLGHGESAAVASDEAMRSFGLQIGRQPAEIIQSAHGVLRPTRGAAMAVALLDPPRNSVEYCGVGNISASILNGAETRSLMSTNGTLGHEARRFQELSYPWSSGALLVMASDGLTSHWQLARYPGLIMRHPSLIAGVLYRDFRRTRDDVTVVVVREKAAR